MRSVAICSILIAVLLLAAVQPAGAATQVTVWPAQFSYATAADTFAWNAAIFGLRMNRSLGPFISLQTSAFYGSAANLSFNGSALGGYSGQVLAGDLAFRLGAGAGPVALAGFAGYGGYALNASGPAASDRVVLSTLGFRVGAEANVALSPLTSLRASYVVVTTQNSDASVSLTSPATAFQDRGSGNGQEYEIVLQFRPIPTTTAFIGYRAGNYSTTWSGGSTTASTMTGMFAGVQLNF